jgi:hypothetical protein
MYEMHIFLMQILAARGAIVVFYSEVRVFLNNLSQQLDHHFKAEFWNCCSGL